MCSQPIQMKKGRPVICQVSPGRRTPVQNHLPGNQTIGLRRHAVDRTTLDRQFMDVETEYGVVRIKVSRMDGEVVNFAPEYDDCVRVAREKNVPLKRVQAAAMNAYLNSGSSGD